MSADYNTTVWGSDLLEYQLANHIGGSICQDSSCRKAAEELIEKRNVEARELNARQFFQSPRGSSYFTHFNDVEREQAHAPNVTHVHNDGSFKLPHNQLWGLGGFGV